MIVQPLPWDEESLLGALQASHRSPSISGIPWNFLCRTKGAEEPKSFYNSIFSIWAVPASPPI